MAILRECVLTLERRGSLDSALAPCANFGEPRVSTHLEAPALIVGEIHMQDVEPVHGHHRDEPLEILNGQEVPGWINEQAAPCERRRITQGKRGDAVGRFRRLLVTHRRRCGELGPHCRKVDDLRERIATIGERRLATGSNRCAVLVDRDREIGARQVLIYADRDLAEGV